MMNRNQKKRLESVQWKEKNRDPIQRYMAITVLALHRRFGFGAERCGKVYRGIRLVIDGTNARKQGILEMIRFVYKETGYPYAKMITGDGNRDMIAAGAIMTVYSNFGFREKRITAMLEEIDRMQEEYRYMSGERIEQMMIDTLTPRRKAEKETKNETEVHAG